MHRHMIAALPTTDIDGNPLIPENISYSIFTDDDEIFTFQWDTYFYDVVDEMTVIPYEIYSDGYDLQSNVVYFYRTNAEGYQRFLTGGLASRFTTQWRELPTRVISYIWRCSRVHQREWMSLLQEILLPMYAIIM